MTLTWFVSLQQLVADAHHRQRIIDRTPCERRLLWIKRIIVNIVVIAIIGGCGYAIYYTSDVASNIVSIRQSYDHDN